MPKMKTKSPREKAREKRAYQEGRRADDDLRQSEQEKNTAAHRVARENSEFREAERKQDAHNHKYSRKNPDLRKVEQTKNTEAHRLARQNFEFRQLEKERDAESHRQNRQDQAFHEQEQEKNTIAHRISRTNPEFRIDERVRDKVAHRVSRTDPEIRTPEKEKDQAYRLARRTDPVKRKLDFEIAEASTAKKRKLAKCKGLEELTAEFNNAIRSSATHVCVSCGRLEYKEKLRRCKETDFVKTVICVETFPIQFCNTCHLSINKNKVPKLCLKNGLDFCEIPRELKDLSPLEERLVALRIPYMQLRAIGFLRQLKIKGAVVNIENDLEVSIKWIPRNFHETSTIQVDLMRRMRYNNPYMSEVIRPGVVKKAATYLVNQSLYKRFAVNLNVDWDMDADTDVEFIVDNEARNARRSYEIGAISSDSCTTGNEIDCQGERDSSDEEVNKEEQNDQEILQGVGAAESLIFSATGATAIRIAPGEGKRPIPLYKDKYAEEMSFPRCYGGQFREIDEKLGISYTDIKKSELLRYDRRACRPTHILFAFRKSFENQLSQAVQVFMRKRQGNKVYTAGDALQAEFLEKLTKNDEGYAIWKNIRNTPPYWQNQSKKAMAMIRQCGKCTFFITLSSGETVWNELLVMLIKSQDGKDISEDEAAALSSERKAELIRNDPVMCTRHFYHRYNKLRTLIFKRENGIFGVHKLTDHFARVEYQMRGAPHIHELIYLQNAPEYIENDPESEALCIEFIDKFITVERDESEEMSELIKLQIHKHSHTCQKWNRNQRQCRFGYPLPPLPSTMFLHPLPKNTSKKEKNRLEELYSKIKTYLKKQGRNPKENPAFETFLKSFRPQIKLNDYVAAIRTSITKLTVFHKREVNAAYINRYNRDLLLIWRANLDIQFVTDTYACTAYCVSYMLKTEGGMSQLMRIASDHVRKGNVEILEKMKACAKVLNNGTEASVQEAVAFLLGLPNTDCSRTDVFVNTSRPEERTVILKSQKELQELPEGSTDIFEKGLIHHYTQRPKTPEFEEMCLAEFATCCNFERAKQPLEDAEINETEMETALEENEQHISSVKRRERFSLLDESGSISRRNPSNMKILRFRNYRKSEDPANYWREQLMLFMPWRDEQTELLDVNAEEIAAIQMDKILLNSKPYFKNREMDDTNIRDLFIKAAEEEEDPNIRWYAHSEDDEEDLVESLLDSIPADHSISKFEQFLPPHFISDEKYLTLMKELNVDQNKFVMQTLKKFKLNETFHLFLHGGAGVGKSHTILAIVQSVLRYSRFIPNFDSSKPPLVVTAPTGKAAFNVFGMTLHCCFNLPRNSFDGHVLSEGALTSLRSRLFEIRLIIIDEISMVSVKQLYQIDQRLRQIFNTDQDFGGRSIIIVGHLRQLSPVAGKYAFDIPTHLNRGVLAGNHLWTQFKFFELNEIMRQRGQLEFCKALNNLSEGCMDDRDVALLRSRTVAKTGPPPFEATHLFQTNKECDEHNQKVHNLLNTPGFLSIAKDSVEGLGTEERRVRLLEQARTLQVKDCDGLKYETFLKEDALYFISTNIDVSDGLFNGATGHLKYIELNKQKNKALCAWMQFPLKVTGEKMRKLHEADIEEKCKENPLFNNLTPIFKITRKIQKNNPGQGLALVRKQFPLVACNGMTITKSQGSTMDTVVVSTKRKLRIQDLYVACSRVTSLEGLFINGNFDPPKLPGPAKNAPEGENRDPVTIALEELRKNPIEFDLGSFSDHPANSIKIYYQNIRTFNKYSENLQSDINASAADVLVLIEPNVLAKDNVHLEGFQLNYRKNCLEDRDSKGILVFSKGGSCQARNFIPRSFESKNGHCFILIFDVKKLAVITIYRHPNFPVGGFMRILEEKFLSVIMSSSSPIILFGDGNLDLSDPNNECFVDLMRKYNFQSLLDLNDPTTNYGSHLDICFAHGLPLSSAFIIETYFSDHKAIGIVH